MRMIIFLFAALLSFGARASGALSLNVTLDYDQEHNHVVTQGIFRDLAKALEKEVGRPVRMIMSQNAERVGERIRTASFDIVLAPAQLIGLAARSGYTPVAKTEEDARILLLARKGAGMTAIENARGKRVVLPHRESLVSYLFNGELNALGLSPSSYFSHVEYMNRYGAVLYAMDIGQAELIAVKESAARDWMKRNKDLVVVRALPEAPAAGVAVNDKLDDATKARVRVAFTRLDRNLRARMVGARLGSFEPADHADFEFVSTRGFYTPEVMTGGTIATAEMVKKLIGEGARLFDVRPHAHYREAHIPGAVNVTYHMNSPKEVDYDDAVDNFDMSKLPTDKNATIIVQCNGAECWYSYKAARYLIKRGYKKVYWFRTGLPAWRAASYPVQRGS